LHSKAIPPLGVSEMAKFAATSIRDLKTDERNNGRVSRRAAYEAKPFDLKTLYAVVCVEASDGSWCEFDAESRDHAKRLANNAVDNLKARGASCWEVAPDGGLDRRSFYTVFEDY
jgi:hypothetical protein